MKTRFLRTLKNGHFKSENDTLVMCNRSSLSFSLYRKCVPNFTNGQIGQMAFALQCCQSLILKFGTF